MNKLSLSVGGMLVALCSASAVSAQEARRYHSCDNVQAFVASLIATSLDDEQQQLLQITLQNRGVNQLAINLAPGDPRSNQQINFTRNVRNMRGPNPQEMISTSSFRLMFGSTTLNVSDEDSCEVG